MEKGLCDGADCAGCARKARDLVIFVGKRSALESMTLPGEAGRPFQSQPCSSEVFIVEGDSVRWSAKQGRDRQFQAILLPGQDPQHRARRPPQDPEQPRDSGYHLCPGIGDQLSVENLRYDRVIIMTDADVDGAHITTLLLTFFFRYMVQLIETGHLYIAQPPLYLVKTGREEQYVFTESDLAQTLRELGGRKVSMQRYKGLGEMNPDQLWETTMDPARRILRRVRIEDAAEADRVFDMLMGSAVPPRRKFIQSHAQEVQNLDV